MSNKLQELDSRMKNLELHFALAMACLDETTTPDQQGHMGNIMTSFFGIAAKHGSNVVEMIGRLEQEDFPASVPS